ncbi:undecaprenyl-phosphate galactose phosphotransferase WbaP [Treponema ruminis]|uniref:Undecaprenyl-phosphate galactose phosphotransferase WbaP n=1 Tax=Treponema ruminis TaxID=744515 RepID=A0A7W8G7R1_9SPIR|nr:undecaprenyl-phosphate galactose phosphotransferase WbaP [Treponema ruminis]MBB5225284.1 Undecaprenyl-phosphate galactose phosphotransferase WbaP [Treponema ruminis]QSI01845.1 undecaprenyl-phosphate galactose phosphotransferase WbaP [Treponema ruminis]
MTDEEFKKYFKKNFWRTSSFTSGAALMVIDCIGVMLSIGITFFIINLINHSWINFRSFVTYWVYLPPTMVVFYAAGLYPGLVYPPADEVKKLGLCSFFIFAGIALSITVEDVEDKLAIVVALICAAPVALILLPAAREFARHLFSKNNWFGVPAVIYVSGNSGDVIIDRLIKRKDLGYKPCLIIDSKSWIPGEKMGIPLYPPSEQTFNMIKSFGIKVAILCDYDRDTTYINSYYRYTIQIPRLNDLSTISTNVRDFGGILGFSSTHNLTKPISLFWKRCIDLLLLLLSSPVTIPVLLLVSLIVKITSPGPIFYGHKRIGKNGKEFKCWKFRSMVIDADKQLEKILAENPEMRAEWEKDRKFTNDPRVTKIGKILRKTSIDEIPQFFNIFTGEMSFIGPRPVTEPELAKYGKKSDFILSVQPGLSGMWQISGRSDTGYEERVTLDSYYIQNWSVWLDIWIIIKTVYVVLRGKGAY